MDSAISKCYISAMKNTKKDRYEKKLRQFLKELEKWLYDMDNQPGNYTEYRNAVMKRYGFTDVDWERALRLTRSTAERNFYVDGIGIKKDALNRKEKSAQKLERDMMSGKQQHFDEAGEAEIKYEDAWIADVFEPNDYDDSFLAKEPD